MHACVCTHDSYPQILCKLKLILDVINHLTALIVLHSTKRRNFSQIGVVGTKLI